MAISGVTSSSLSASRVLRARTDTSASLTAMAELMLTCSSLSRRACSSALRARSIAEVTVPDHDTRANQNMNVMMWPIVKVKTRPGGLPESATQAATATTKPTQPTTASAVR